MYTDSLYHLIFVISCSVKYPFCTIIQKNITSECLVLTGWMITKWECSRLDLGTLNPEGCYKASWIADSSTAPTSAGSKSLLIGISSQLQWVISTLSFSLRRQWMNLYSVILAQLIQDDCSPFEVLSPLYSFLQNSSIVFLGARGASVR